MSTENILMFNASLYTITLVFVVFLKKHLSIGLCLWTLFTISAWSSFFFSRHPLFKGSIHDNPICIEAIFYLYIYLFICIFPFFNVVKLRKINYFFSNRHIKWLKSIMLCVSILQILFILVDLPQLGHLSTSSQSSLVDMRENVYEGGNSLVTRIPALNRVMLIYTGIQPISIGLSLVLLLFCKQERGTVKLFFITNMLTILYNILINVSRGEIVSNSIYLGLILVYMRDYLSKKMKRKLILCAIPTIVLGVSFFWAISVSRFEDLATFMLYKYPGEPMVNFCGILYPNIREYTNGHAYLLSWFYREYASGLEKWDYIEGITKIPAYIFYTYVGGFFIEFGKIGAMIVALILNFIVSRTYKSLNFSFIFVVLFFCYFYGYGVFLFKLQNFQALFYVFFTCFFYFLFKNNKLLCCLNQPNFK